MDRKTILALADRYNRREALNRHKERCMDKNLWIGVLTRGAEGKPEPGSNARGYTDAEQIIDVLGGLGAVAIMVKHTLTDAIEDQMRKLDAEIAELGGEP